MDHPISLSVTDDLGRNRWTVGFRWLLVIPHLIWLTLWGIAVSFAVIASWFAARCSPGRLPRACTTSSRSTCATRRT